MIRWFAAHPTAASLLLVLILAAGVMATPTLIRETFPDFRPTEVEIAVIYRGAAAEDVEDGVCRRLWDGLEAVEGLKELVCTAQDSVARAVATMGDGSDVDRVVDEIRTEVAAIDDLPERADPPVVRELHRADLVASVAITGDLPPVQLELYAEELQDRIAALPGVARVELSGCGERQFRITVPRDVLAQHDLSAASLAGIIRAQSIDSPAGALEGKRQEFRRRFVDERRAAADLADLTILSRTNGAELKLGQIAKIEDTHAPAEERALLDGERAALLAVHKPLGADALAVLDRVNDCSRKSARRCRRRCGPRWCRT